jgi:hypothetical protein
LTAAHAGFKFEAVTTSGLRFSRATQRLTYRYSMVDMTILRASSSFVAVESFSFYYIIEVPSNFDICREHTKHALIPILFFHLWKSCASLTHKLEELLLAETENRLSMTQPEVVQSTGRAQPSPLLFSRIA